MGSVALVGQPERGSMLPVGIKLTSGTAMLLIGQTEPVANAFPYADLLVQGGALVVLAWAVWHAYQTVIPSLKAELIKDRESHLLAQRACQDAYTTAIENARIAFSETLDRIVDRSERLMSKESDRHNEWEKIRHEDSTQTRETLTQLSVTCAGAQRQFSSDPVSDS